MKTKNLLHKILGSIFLFCIVSCANEPTIPVWEITKKNCKTSYIAGITEYLNENSNPDIISDNIINLFDSSKIYITHFDEKNSDPILINNKIGIGNNLQLQNVLSKEELSTLNSKKKIFDDKNNLTQILSDSSEMKLIFYITDILDQIKQNCFYFESLWLPRAIAQKKIIEGLETRQRYYETFSNIKQSEQVEFMHSIDDFKDFSLDFSTKINNLYLNEKYIEIKNLYLQKHSYLKTNSLLFFENKHKKWATKLDSKFKENSCFVSLDIIHLVGEQNILDLLISKGYSVNKIQ